MPASALNPIRFVWLLPLYVLLLAVPARAQANSTAMGMDHTPRTLSGTITSPSHEPLRGAVVKLQQGDSPNIITFVTAADGRYTFKRLNGNEDYRVWVTFRARTSKPKEVSKFDSKMDKVIDFTIETF